MYQIFLGNESKQKITWKTPKNEDVLLSFEYKENQLGWFLGIQYNDVDYKNIRITTHANLLRSYLSYLGFGIMVITQDGFEPMDINDFHTDYCHIYMLTKEECLLVEGELYAKISA